MFQSIEDTEFIVFDTETTGLSADGDDRIVEIGALKIKNGEITDEIYEVFVNPERQIPYIATSINGITNEMVADAPKMDEVWAPFREFIGDGVIVAHNAKFDMDFLKAHMERAGVPMSELPESICTMKMSKVVFAGEKGHSLEKVAARLFVERDPNASHRALYDVQVTAECFLKMIQKAGYKMRMDLDF